LWGITILLAMLVSLMLQLAGLMYLSGIEVNAAEALQPMWHMFGPGLCCLLRLL
jgi:hypothetical protein